MLVRSNTTSPTSVKYGAGLDRVGDPGVGENPWPQCLYDPTAALFNAIELNQGMHISPIALVPWAMSHNEQQLLFNAEKVHPRRLLRVLFTTLPGLSQRSAFDVST
jgi:hypothetical protein